MIILDFLINILAAFFKWSIFIFCLLFCILPPGLYMALTAPTVWYGWFSSWGLPLWVSLALGALSFIYSFVILSFMFKNIIKSLYNRIMYFDVEDYHAEITQPISGASFQVAHEELWVPDFSVSQAYNDYYADIGI